MTKQDGKEETPQKAIATIAGEAVNYLKSLKRTAGTGALSKKHATALLEMTRASIDAIEARLSGLK